MNERVILFWCYSLRTLKAAWFGQQILLVVPFQAFKHVSSLLNLVQVAATSGGGFWGSARPGNRPAERRPRGKKGFFAGTAGILVTITIPYYFIISSYLANSVLHYYVIPKCLKFCDWNRVDFPSILILVIQGDSFDAWNRNLLLCWHLFQIPENRCKSGKIF